MFKKLRSIILKAILNEFKNVYVNDYDGGVEIVVKEQFQHSGHKKFERQIYIDMFEYVEEVR